MGPVGEGLVGTIIGMMVVVALIFVGIGSGITKLTQKKELVVSKPLVPVIRLTTDGKKIDTVYVYKIR